MEEEIFIDSLMETWKGCIDSYRSDISLPLLEFVWFILRNASAEIGFALAKTITTEQYYNTIQNCSYEIADIILQIVSWLILFDDVEFHRFFFEISAIYDFHDSFYDTGLSSFRSRSLSLAMQL
jgi:hypothetical protein